MYEFIAGSVRSANKMDCRYHREPRPTLQLARRVRSRRSDDQDYQCLLSTQLHKDVRNELSYGSATAKCTRGQLQVAKLYSRFGHPGQQKPTKQLALPMPWRTRNQLPEIVRQTPGVPQPASLVGTHWGEPAQWVRLHVLPQTRRHQRWRGARVVVSAG
jgi:hypothetical protein